MVLVEERVKHQLSMTTVFQQDKAFTHRKQPLVR